MSYCVSLAGAYIAAVVIEKLGPTFASSGSTVQALKMVAYASTPVWVAGVAHVIPVLSALVTLVAAVYAIYLFYLGLPPVMKTPQDKVVPYMLVSALAIIVVNIVLGLIVGAVMGMGYGYGRMM